MQVFLRSLPPGEGRSETGSELAVCPGGRQMRGRIFVGIGQVRGRDNPRQRERTASRRDLPALNEGVFEAAIAMR